MEFLKNFFIGIAVGIANIIPGVSGGTIAVIFNIYDRLVNSITLNLKKLWQNRMFLLSLFLGAGIGIVGFSKLISYLYECFPIQTDYCFCGLIVGSVPLLLRFTLRNESEEKFSAAKKISLALCIIAGIAVLVCFSHLEGNVDKDAAKVADALPPVTAGTELLLFVAGILGAVAMIIPGISGSLLLLILGAYTIILNAVSSLTSAETFFHAFLLIVPCGIGVVAGLFGGAKLISVLLRRIPNQTYAVILGLLIGSAVHVFPGFREIAGFGSAVACSLTFAAGFSIAYFSSEKE